MTNKDFLSKIMIVATFVLISFSNNADAETRMYKFDRVPDVDGMMLRDGKLNIVLGMASETKDALNTYMKILPLPLAGGSRCKTLDIADAGIFMDIRSCVNLRKIGAAKYTLSVASDFKYKDEVPGDWEEMKNLNLVRHRKMQIDFSFDSSSCNAVVRSRSYMPLDSNGFVQSRIGAIGCAVAQ